MSISDVLSKDEVSALLSQADVDDGNSGNPEGATAEDYDFASNYEESITESDGLQSIDLLFNAQMQRRMFITTHRKTPVESLNIETTSYKEYISNLELPTAINLFNVKQLNTPIIIAVSGKFIFSAIEIFYGGKVANSKDLERAFGKVDLKVARLLGEVICESASNSWESVKKLDFEYQRNADTPILLKAFPDDEKLIVQKYQITIDEIPCEYHFCIPRSALEPIRHLLDSDSEKMADQKTKQAWEEKMRFNLNKSKFKLTTCLSETDIQLKKLLQLKVGDIIAIDTPEACDVLIEGERVFKAQAGLNNGNKVIEIIGNNDD